MLVDTDILIDYLREVPAAVEFVEANIDRISVSVISIAELYQGVRDGEEREALDDFLSVLTDLDLNFETAKTAGLFRRQFKRSHNPGLADCLIAATAQARQLPLKTLNKKHFPMLEDVEVPYHKE